MEVDAMLCDHAEVADQKLFINGAGISILFVQPVPPHPCSFGVAATIHLPYHATNQPHTYKVKLLDEDGNPVSPAIPGLAEPMGPVEIEATFNVGRPPGIPAGEAQVVPFAFNFQGLPLPALGLYSIVIEIDGTEMRRLPVRAMAQP